MGPEESDEDDPNDPMVSNPVRPFVIPVVIQNTRSGVGDEQSALIDSGCTQCLIRQSVVDNLAIWVRTLQTPIRFEQMDGSILGGVPATHVTELVRLEIGEHWEYIRFVVVDTMIEPLILGLTWLDKWQPTIWWEEGFRKLRLPLGP